jgi:uncharacterized protein
VRKLEAIDLWEISIVTFPLLNGARVRAKGVSFSYPRRDANASGDALRAPKLSPARAHAERAWRELLLGNASARPRSPPPVVRRRAFTLGPR